MGQFIEHHSTLPWGGCIYYMEKEGSAVARIYWYNDDDTTVYLDSLSVSPMVRKQGIGTVLQEMREEVGRKMGATTACLWVYKNTWMLEWYRRRGYRECKEHDTENNAIWMEKEL